MGALFGGSKSKSTQSNRAFDTINQNFGGLQGMATTGANAFQALLNGDSSGFDRYKDATGFDFAAEQGSRGITGNAAARGNLRSGSTGEALVTFGNNIQNQFANNYLDRLLGQAGLGFQAGGLISGAGGVGQSTSKSKPGLGGFLGQLSAGAAASDRRLKEKLVEIGFYGNVPLYQYEYSAIPGVTQIGVMAQDVAEHYPEALGPEVFGYMTVDYGTLKGLVRNELG